MELNIFLCGIGGQGVVFLGSFLRNYLLSKYPDGIILGTESRGVSQREGSVIASVRIQTDPEQQRIYCPEISPMTADIVIALEPLELLRNFHVIHKNSLIVTNNEPIIPKSSVQWMMKQPSDEKTNQVRNHSKPEWLIDKIQDLMNQIPEVSKRKKISYQDKLKEMKGELNKITSFSTIRNIFDVNFSSLTLNELEDSSNLNLVMLGFCAGITDSLLKQESLKKFIDTNSYIKERNKKKNQVAIDFGASLANTLTSRKKNQ